MLSNARTSSSTHLFQYSKCDTNLYNSASDTRREDAKAAKLNRGSAMRTKERNNGGQSAGKLDNKVCTGTVSKIAW
jgi:hypothetical protein